MDLNTGKTLIVGPSWVGDMVMAQSLCIDIKQRFPDSELHVLAPAWTAALIDRMPEVHSLIAVDFKHGKFNLKDRLATGRRLKAMGFAHCIVLPNSLKSALVPWLAKIPNRIGWLGEQRWGLITDVRRLDKQRWPMTVQRFIALGEPKNAPVRAISQVPAPKLRVDVDNQKQVLNNFGLSLDKPVLALCPGAEFGASKQWPAEYYAAAAKSFIDRGWQVWLMGSQKDVPTCEQINAEAGGDSKVLGGKTSLPEAIDLLSAAQMVISNDSGLMHVAAALSIPLVAIYGSTDPGHTPPLSANHVIARLNLDCSPCFERECPLVLSLII